MDIPTRVELQVAFDKVFRDHQAALDRIAELERQNSDLQGANNRYLERARAAEAELAEQKKDPTDWEVIAAIPKPAGTTYWTHDVSAAIHAFHSKRCACAHKNATPALDDVLAASSAEAAIGYGEPIRNSTAAREVDGYLAGVVVWEGVEHPVMAIPVAKGFLLHIYAWSQLERRAATERAATEAV